MHIVLFNVVFRLILIFNAAPNKLNQDAYCIHESYGGESEQAFFGVFDGHGKAGTECSQFIRKELPKVLLNVMQKRKSKTLQENLVAAHLNTNTMVRLVIMIPSLRMSTLLLNS